MATMSATTSDGMTLKVKVGKFLESKTPEEVEAMNVKAVRRGVCEMFGISELTDKQKAQIKVYIQAFFERQATASAVAAEKKAAAALAATAQPAKRKATLVVARQVSGSDGGGGGSGGGAAATAAVAEDDDDDDDDDNDNDDGAPPVKKKAAVAAKKAPAKEPTCWVKTPSGLDPPKFLKKAQARAMKTKTFLSNAGDLEVDIFGNTIGGVPRVFSSGNKGWYCGGKIQIKIGKKKLWAHCGLNITVLGSKDWKD